MTCDLVRRSPILRTPSASDAVDRRDHARAASSATSATSATTSPATPTPRKPRAVAPSPPKTPTTATTTTTTGPRRPPTWDAAPYPAPWARRLRSMGIDRVPRRALGPRGSWAREMPCLRVLCNRAACSSNSSRRSRGMPWGEGAMRINVGLRALGLVHKRENPPFCACGFFSAPLRMPETHFKYCLSQRR